MTGPLMLNSTANATSTNKICRVSSTNTRHKILQVHGMQKHSTDCRKQLRINKNNDYTAVQQMALSTKVFCLRRFATTHTLKNLPSFLVQLNLLATKKTFYPPFLCFVNSYITFAKSSSSYVQVTV